MMPPPHLVPHDTFFISTIEQFSYLGIFFFAIFSGYIIPVPEEITLLIVGYMASMRIIHLTPAIFVVIIAFIIGDNILFRLVLKNNKFVEKLIHDVLSLKFIVKHKEFLEKHMHFTIFFTRFFPFLRFVGPVYAGYAKAKESVFMTFNTLAIIIYAPIVMSIGYLFHQDFNQIVGQIVRIRHIGVILIWIIVGLIITRITDYFFRKTN